MTEKESFTLLDTNTCPASAITPAGLLPPELPAPNGKPVRINFITRGCDGSATFTTHKLFDSGTFGSPSPGTRTAPPLAFSRTAPSRASGEGNPNAGNVKPVALAFFTPAPGIGWYENMPMFVI